MIIFDLDATLANCEHRRHFVDRDHPINENKRLSEISLVSTAHPEPDPYNWKPDWKSFYEFCDKDDPIFNTISVLNSLRNSGFEIQTWSGRCESVRSKTEYWINYYIETYKWNNSRLKMRPIGDSTPNEVLYETWLNERCADMIQHIFEGKPYACKHDIDFVFSANPDVIRMFQKRGIFVFNCAQNYEEF